MFQLKKVISTTLLVVLCSFIFSGVVNAHNGVDHLNGEVHLSETRKVAQRTRERSSVETRVGERVDLPATTSAGRCTTTETRIGLRIDHYRRIKERHIKRYEHVSALIKRLIQKVEMSGEDTVKLESLLAMFEEKVEKFSVDTDELLAQLAILREYACSDRDAFEAELIEARELLAVVREDVADIKTFYIEELRPVVTALIVSQASTDAEAR